MPAFLSRAHETIAPGPGGSPGAATGTIASWWGSEECRDGIKDYAKEAPFDPLHASQRTGTR